MPTLTPTANEIDVTMNAPTEVFENILKFDDEDRGVFGSAMFGDTQIQDNTDAKIDLYLEQEENSTTYTEYTGS